MKYRIEKRSGKALMHPDGTAKVAPRVEVDRLWKYITGHNQTDGYYIWGTREQQDIAKQIPTLETAQFLARALFTQKNKTDQASGLSKLNAHDCQTLRAILLELIDDGDPATPKAIGGADMWHPMWRLYDENEVEANDSRLRFCEEFQRRLMKAGVKVVRK